MVAPAIKEPSSSRPRQRKRKGVSAISPLALTLLILGTPQETRTETSPGTQAEREPGPETIERDAVQPEVGPQPLLPGNSKNVRPRARPLKRAKSQAHVTSGSPPQAQSTGQIQPATSGAAVVGAVEFVHASPPTQVENEDSHEDPLQLPQKRTNLTLHQLNHADKRQKISDQVQSENVAETMNCSADVDAAAKGNYTLMGF